MWYRVEYVQLEACVGGGGQIGTQCRISGSKTNILTHDRRTCAARRGVMHQWRWQKCPSSMSLHITTAHFPRDVRCRHFFHYHFYNTGNVTSSSCSSAQISYKIGLFSVSMQRSCFLRPAAYERGGIVLSCVCLSLKHLLFVRFD